MQDQAEKEAAGQVNMNEIERKAIEELAQALAVTIQDITADGHCLYNAISDQLLQHYNIEVRGERCVFEKKKMSMGPMSFPKDRKQMKVVIKDSRATVQIHTHCFPPIILLVVHTTQLINFLTLFIEPFSKTCLLSLYQATVKELRRDTAEYMREHADDFLPFLTNKQGDMMSSGDFAEYCGDLESTAVWGGQPEV